jgi:hypothetical protein
VTDVVDIAKARLNINVGKAYRNWIGRLGDDFGLSTRLCHISDKSLRFLAGGVGNSPFYLYDLIMNLQGLGSGFEFNDLDPKNKMSVMDRHLFLLDQIRFEYMKRLGWLDSYAGEEIPIVELVLQFDQLAPGMHARPPVLSKNHSAYSSFCEMNQFEKEELIRKLVGEALQEMRDYPTTL